MRHPEKNGFKADFPGLFGSDRNGETVVSVLKGVERYELNMYYTTESGKYKISRKKKSFSSVAGLHSSIFVVDYG